MKTDSLVVIDLIRKKEEHYVFNNVTIKALSTLAKSIDFYLSNDSALLDDMPNNIITHKVKVEKAKFYFWIKSSYKTLCILIKNKNKTIFLSATPLQYLLLGLASLATGRKIYIFMHGELGYLKSPTGIGQRLGAKFIDLAFKFKKLNFICINAPICDAITQMYPENNFIHIEHPIQNDSSPGEKNKAGITFGSFGIQSKDKGSESIYKLAEQINKKETHKVSLITVGVSDGSFQYDLSPAVSHYCTGMISNSLIPREIFYKNVKRIDVALLFNSNAYNAEKYDLISSGVFADCIAFSMPVIAIKNKKIESYFKLYGEFGVLCNNLEEMAEAITYINNNPDALSGYKYILRGVQEKLKPEGYVKEISEKIYHD